MRWFRGPGLGCCQKILVWPDSFSLFWAALSLDCLWYSRCRRVQVWHRVSSGIRGSPHSTQIPRSLAFSLLCCMLRRFSSLCSGVWDLWRSYSRRVSFLASTSVDIGWARGFGALGWGAVLGVAFFRLALGFAALFLRGAVDFLGFPSGLGTSKVKLSTNICLLGRFIPGIAGRDDRLDLPVAVGVDLTDRYRGRLSLAMDWDIGAVLAGRDEKAEDLPSLGL